MAGMSISIARSMKDSGAEAASRKLKALAAWSSMYSSAGFRERIWSPRDEEASVIIRVQEPLVVEVVVDEKAGEGFACGSGCHHVPLFDVPAIDVPPGAAGLPRAIGYGDVVTGESIAEDSWFAVVSLERECVWRPDAPERCACGCSLCGLGTLVDDGEVAHLKMAGTVRVEEGRGANAIGADHGFEA